VSHISYIRWYAKVAEGSRLLEVLAVFKHIEFEDRIETPNVFLEVGLKVWPHDVQLIRMHLPRVVSKDIIDQEIFKCNSRGKVSEILLDMGHNLFLG
jgi:hypothetical protein